MPSESVSSHWEFLPTEPESDRLRPAAGPSRAARMRDPAGAGEDVHWQTAEAASVPFGRADLEIFARVHSLVLDDRTMQGAGLWVRTDDSDKRISRVLVRWGFSMVAGQGWRR